MQRKADVYMSNIVFKMRRTGNEDVTIEIVKENFSFVAKINHFYFILFSLNSLEFEKKKRLFGKNCVITVFHSFVGMLKNKI